MSYILRQKPEGFIVLMYIIITPLLQFYQIHFCAYFKFINLIGLREVIRSDLRFQTFPGGPCPQTSYIGTLVGAIIIQL